MATGAAVRVRTWLSAAQAEDLVLAFVLTICASAIDEWSVFENAWRSDVAGVQRPGWDWYRRLGFLGMALLLALPTWRRSGLRPGALGRHWRGVLLVCGAPVLAAAVVYPQLPVRPFSHASAAMWTISPVAQELVFTGYLYGRLEQSFPGTVHPRVPVARALVLTSFFFGLWHVPNFFSLPAGYVAFQLFYTGVLSIIPGLSRQWTGSIYYVTLTHAAINFIAWYFS